MATRFWVGGTGTWDNSDTTHWATGSGGGGGASVPTSADTVTFDGSSGGGTVTVAATINGNNTLQSITCGAFTGTLDFSVNNPSITMGSWSGTGSGARTIKLGSGTFTITSNAGTVWNMTSTTSLTWDAGTSTVALNSGATNNNRTFTPGILTYGTISIGANASSGILTLNDASAVYTNLSVSSPNCIVVASSAARTVTNAPTISGSSLSSSGVISFIGSPLGANGIFTTASGTASFTYCAFRNITGSGGATFTASNSVDLGGNSGITITAPTIGGGGVIGVIGS